RGDASASTIRWPSSSGFALSCASISGSTPYRSKPMRRRVVIADDEPNLVIPLEYMLQREGFDVTVARDGQQALDAIARVHPDLVLLDVMMPRKSGFDVCQVLRADEAKRDV